MKVLEARSLRSLDKKMLSEANKKNEDLDKCADVIKKKCKSIVRFYHKSKYTKVLVRGTKKKDMWFDRIQHKSVRKPVDTPEDVDRIIEAYRKFNKPNLPSRQKSYFCLGSKNVEKSGRTDYGDPYAIFPYDGSNFMQNMEIDDMYASEAIMTGMSFIETLSYSWSYIRDLKINSALFFKDEIPEDPYVRRLKSILEDIPARIKISSMTASEITDLLDNMSLVYSTFEQSRDLPKNFAKALASDEKELAFVNELCEKTREIAKIGHRLNKGLIDYFALIDTDLNSFKYDYNTEIVIEGKGYVAIRVEYFGEIMELLK